MNVLGTLFIFLFKILPIIIYLRILGISDIGTGRGIFGFGPVLLVLGLVLLLVLLGLAVLVVLVAVAVAFGVVLFTLFLF